MAGLPARIARLPRWQSSPQGLDVRVAVSHRARLTGLAGLRSLPPGTGLLLPRTRSVHTLGMRFALDLVWLDHGGVPLRIDRDVAPLRACRCPAASAVVELAAGSWPDSIRWDPSSR